VHDEKSMILHQQILGHTLREKASKRGKEAKQIRGRCGFQIRFFFGGKSQQGELACGFSPFGVPGQEGENSRGGYKGLEGFLSLVEELGKIIHGEFTRGVTCLLSFLSSVGEGGRVLRGTGEDCTLARFPYLLGGRDRKIGLEIRKTLVQEGKESQQNSRESSSLFEEGKKRHTWSQFEEYMVLNHFLQVSNSKGNYLHYKKTSKVGIRLD